MSVAMRVSVVLGAILLLAFGLATTTRVNAVAADPTPKPPLAYPPPPPSFPGGAAPPPIAAPTTRAGINSSQRTYENAVGGWAVTLPADWHVSAGDDAAWAIVTSYDPAAAIFQQGIDIRRKVGVVPTTELRINVEAWPNPRGLTPDAWVAASASGRVSGTVEPVSQTAVRVGGQAGIALVQRELSSDTKTRTIGYYIFASRDASRIYIVSVHPLNSLRWSQFQTLLAGFEVKR